MNSRQVEKAGSARVGTVLKDKWQLDALLGIGGMAWVYAATHRNKNQVAIKLLFPEMSVDAEVRRRFLREGYAANSIGHPGAVTVFDDDVTEDGLAFLVMELLDGTTLADLRRTRGGRLDAKVVLTAIDGVLGVLAAAHDKGIIHRDIKPGNVFLTQSRGVKVVDFGIARIHEGHLKQDLTRSGFLLGSAAYMSPEQARGRWEEVDPRTDLFSVGATMFQLLVGRPVHAGNSPQERIVSAVSTPAPSLATLLPNAPRPLVRVVDRALEFEKDRRWQNAREMQEAVRDALKRLRTLDSTLVMSEGPDPLPSSPFASAPPSSAPVAPAPELAPERPPAVVAAGAPARAPKPANSLGATRVYGSPSDQEAIRAVRAWADSRDQFPSASGESVPVETAPPLAARAPALSPMTHAHALPPQPPPQTPRSAAFAAHPMASQPVAHPIAASPAPILITAPAPRRSAPIPVRKPKKRRWLMVLVVLGVLGTSLVALGLVGVWYSRQHGAGIRSTAPAATE